MARQHKVSKPISSLIFSFFLICSVSQSALAAQKKQNAPVITVAVDATEAPRKIFHARLVIPVTPGPLTFFYPKWIPGEHGPSGPVIDVAGLKLSAAGKQIPWQRDLLDMYTFHCEIPAGANSLEVSLDYLSPNDVEGFSSGASATSQLTVISWNQLLVYPQGWTAEELTYAASLKLPEGWKFGTALPVTKESGQAIEFKPVSLTTLVDSPVISGAHFQVIDLSPGATPSHEIDIAGDSEAAISMSPDLIAKYRQLVAQANALFGAHHYQQYHFLFALSDYVSSFGLEHHDSSDNRVAERTLLEDQSRMWAADLLPHEMVHSWNGKYRRPADLTTPDFQKPMKTDLLWVYEGLTQYLGALLTARSGLWSAEEYRENLAWVAAYLDQRTGRAWRPLVDTAVSAQLLYGARLEWEDWRRRVDFYDEMLLIWLEADTVIRQQSQGQKSLDDFCRRFHGAPSGPPAVKTYTFEDVVAELNAVCPYDWRAFLASRVNSTASHGPLGGVEASGWRLVFTEEPNRMRKAGDSVDKSIDLRFSIGLILKQDGTVKDVIPGKPAAEAGMAPSMKLLAVNGRRWTELLLREAIKATKEKPNLELMIENGDFIQSYVLKYQGGERYPHLERDAAKPDLLQQIIQPLKVR